MGDSKDDARLDFSGQDLRGHDFSGQDLRGANFEGANLEEANLSRANLHRADLSKCNLERADLSGAVLHEARLVDAVLAESKMLTANLFKADLTGADLRRVDFLGGNLSAARLVGASLRSANLRGVNLSASDLREADLRGANLYSARFAKAVVTAEQLLEWRMRGASIDATIYRKSGLSPLQLRALVAAGCEVADLFEFPRDALAALGGGLDGLTLYFSTRLTPIRRFVIDGLILGVLGRATECHVVDFRQLEETSTIRLVAPDPTDLEFIAAVLWDFVSDPGETDGLAEAHAMAHLATKELRDEVLFLRKRLERMVLQLTDEQHQAPPAYTAVSRGHALERLTGEEGRHVLIKNETLLPRTREGPVVVESPNGPKYEWRSWRAVLDDLLASSFSVDELRVLLGRYPDVLCEPGQVSDKLPLNHFVSELRIALERRGRIKPLFELLLRERKDRADETREAEALWRSASASAEG